MTKILQAKSTLTDRYQTTIPESIRKALNLAKRDKITYIVEDNGKVIISRTISTDSDPAITQFLSCLAKDIAKHPKNIHSLNSDLLNRAQQLTKGVEVDLDKPLDDQDE